MEMSVKAGPAELNPAAALAETFQYRLFRFDFHFVDEGFPSGWISNLFRGAFGATLRRITCFCPREHGEPAREGGAPPAERHLKACVYSEMFESPVSHFEQPEKRLTTHAPHPFVLFVDRISDQGHGRVDLVLFGSALKYFPYALITLVQMGQRGLGRARSRFALDAVTSGGEAVYDIEEEEILAYRAPQVFQPSGDLPREIGLRLVSPLWLVSGGRQMRSFEVHAFFAALARRIESLMRCYQGIAPEWERRDLLQRLERDVHVVHHRTSYVEKPRYSRRQDAKMDVGGLLGEVVLGGDLREAMDLLELGAIIHNGKKTSFGNGKYELFGTGKTNDE